MEPWSVVLEAKDKSGRWNISAEARQTLDVTFSPAALRSLGDSLTFSKLLYESLHPAGTTPSEVRAALCPVRGSSLLCLANKVHSVLFRARCSVSCA